MRISAVLALVGLLAGVAGPCPSIVRCADRSRSSGHHCCCGDAGQCQCHLGARAARSAPGAEATTSGQRQPAADSIWTTAASGVSVVAVVEASVAASFAGATWVAAPASPVHLELPVFRC
jgi:hypothetical protein